MYHFWKLDGNWLTFLTQLNSYQNWSLLLEPAIFLISMFLHQSPDHNWFKIPLYAFKIHTFFEFNLYSTSHKAFFDEIFLVVQFGAKFTLLPKPHKKRQFTSKIVSKAPSW